MHWYRKYRTYTTENFRPKNSKLFKQDDNRLMTTTYMFLVGFFGEEAQHLHWLYFISPVALTRPFFLRTDEANIVHMVKTFGLVSMLYSNR